jgi:hypothetical protein
MVLLILIQALNEPSTAVPLGVGGGIAALVLGLWRVDRKDSQERYAALAKESNERAAEIAADFRTIVQDNTRAITQLAEKLESADAVTVRMLVEVLRKNKFVNLEP